MLSKCCGKWKINRFVKSDLHDVFALLNTNKERSIIRDNSSLSYTQADK